MNRTSIAVFLALLMICLPLSAQKKQISFKKDVMPLVKAKCLPCHAQGNSNPGQYNMETYDAIVKGGRHGAAVVPGKPDAGTLVQKVKASPSFGEQMPVMTKTKLTPDEIAILETWIKQGAKK
jgi:uncharacterized membrane protein